MKILGWIRFEEFDVLVSVTQKRKDEVGDQVVHVWLEMIPHRLWLDALFKEDESVGKRRLAEPLALRHPLFDLPQISLQDLWREGGDEALRILCVIGSAGLCNRGRVAISERRRVSLSVPAYCATQLGHPTNLMKRRLRFAYDHFLHFHQWFSSLSSTSSTMEFAGGVLAMIRRNNVHQSTVA